MNIPLHTHVSAPGKLMLMGEHAVCHGHLSVVCAIDKRIHVTLRPLDTRELMIDSALGQQTYSLEHPPENPALPFAFYAAYQQLKPVHPGFYIHIDSEFPSHLGLGSSAAVTAAVCFGIRSALGFRDTPHDLFCHAKKSLDRAQKTGSGADLAASIFGGTIAYRADPLAITRLANSPYIKAIYSGNKKPTIQVIEQINQQIAENPNQYKQFFHELNELSKEAVTAITQKQWKTLGRLMTKHQSVQNNMHLSTPAIDQAITYFNKQSKMLGSKISGAGKGDCVVAVCEHEDTPHPSTPLSDPLSFVDLQISQTGVRHECT